ARRLSRVACCSMLPVLAERESAGFYCTRIGEQDTIGEKRRQHRDACRHVAASISAFLSESKPVAGKGCR
ncbi:MAG: hypothetical protein D3906_08325, partial [Candidatus Electrothrix sp. AUS1_2]|nr:hypothetical protein [Candidatus Electrothrix sp. AUS1_2]